VRDGRNFRL